MSSRDKHLAITMHEQEAPLSQRDRATSYVCWNLVKCCTAVRKITFEKAYVRNDLEGHSRSSELLQFDRP